MTEETGMVASAFNPSHQEAEAGGALCSEPLSQNEIFKERIIKTLNRKPPFTGRGPGADLCGP